MDPEDCVYYPAFTPRLAAYATHVRRYRGCPWRGKRSINVRLVGPDCEAATRLFWPPGRLQPQKRENGVRDIMPCVISHRIYNRIIMQGIVSIFIQIVLAFRVRLSQYGRRHRRRVLNLHNRSRRLSRRMTIAQRLRSGRLRQLRSDKVLYLREDIHQHVHHLRLFGREDLPSQTALSPLVLQHRMRLGHKDPVRLWVSSVMRGGELAIPS